MYGRMSPQMRSKPGAVFVIKRAELVRDLLNNVCGNLADICIGLQIAAGHIQRQLGAIKHAAEAGN